MAVVVGLLLAACDPVPHTVAVSRQSETSPVTFRLLSGNGRFVVVTSTGPSSTTPAAGTWRIDRGTGAAVSLSATTAAPRRISGNGARVLLADGTLWSSGATSTPPAGAVFSSDLTAIAYSGPDGLIRSQRYPVGPTWAVEDGFPRPAGSIGPATAKAVADDGRTVQYLLPGSPRRLRFVDLDSGSLVEREDGTSSSLDGTAESFTLDLFALSADGSRLAHAHEEGTEDTDANITLLDASWVELVDVASGSVAARWDSITGIRTRELRIGGFGHEAWLYQSRVVSDPALCPSQSPSTASCTTESIAVAVEPGGAHLAQLGAGFADGVQVSRNGRFLLVSKELFPIGGRSAVTVVDWLSSRTTERLVGAETYTESNPVICLVLGGSSAPCALGTSTRGGQISDDGRLVATTSGLGTGWYELTPPP